MREARAAELKAEIVNSKKLAGYFKENAGVICWRFRLDTCRRGLVVAGGG